MVSTTRRAQGFLVLALALLAGSASAWKRTAVIVFGDGLSDAGNFYRATNYSAPSSPPYWRGRFTTARGVWSDQLPTYVRSPLYVHNFAFAGATACRHDFVLGPFAHLPAAEDLAKRYLDAVEAPNSKLARSHRGHTVVPWFWLGLNDVQYMLYAPQDQMQQTAMQLSTNVSTCLSSAARLLLDNGHKYIVLSTLPPFELTPLAIHTNMSTKAAQLIRLINANISAAVKSLQAEYPNAIIILNDAYTEISSVMREHKRSGFKYGPPSTCFKGNFSIVDGEVPTHVCKKPDEYVFVDEVHPSPAGHRIMVRSVLKTMVKSKLLTWFDTRYVPLAKW